MTGQEWIELADRLKYPVLAAFVLFIFRNQIGALLLRLQELGWLGGKAKFRPPQNQNAASAKVATEEIKDSAVAPRTEPTIIVPALTPSPPVSAVMQPVNLPKSRLQIEVEGHIRNDSRLHGLGDAAKVEVLIHH